MYYIPQDLWVNVYIISKHCLTGEIVCSICALIYSTKDLNSNSLLSSLRFCYLQVIRWIDHGNLTMLPACSCYKSLCKPFYIVIKIDVFTILHKSGQHNLLDIQICQILTTRVTRRNFCYCYIPRGTNKCPQVQFQKI